jgi:dTDP-glucose 4,6-dehydratase
LIWLRRPALQKEQFYVLPVGVYADCVIPLASEDLEHILEHTRVVWEQARGRRVFLTGCTGFFGAWMLESLVVCNRALDLNVSATVLSRDPEKFHTKMPHLASEPALNWLQGDIRDFVFPEGDFEYILHGAASTTADAAAEPRELLSTLIQGTERMLAFAKVCGATRFLLASSGAVYGTQPATISHIPEDYFGGPLWLDPKAPYASGKRVSERMCTQQARESNIRLTIARCFAFVGPHLPMDQHFAIGNFIRDALARRDIVVKGDGTPMRSYLYAADLAIWLWTMLLGESTTDANPEVFNVGSGDAISIADLANMVVEELNPALQVKIAQKAVEGEPRLQYVPDVTRAEARFGLRPLIGLREAIRRTASWHRLQS